MHFCKASKVFDAIVLEAISWDLHDVQGVIATRSAAAWDDIFDKSYSSLIAFYEEISGKSIGLSHSLSVARFYDVLGEIRKLTTGADVNDDGEGGGVANAP